MLCFGRACFLLGGNKSLWYDHLAVFALPIFAQYLANTAMTGFEAQLSTRQYTPGNVTSNETPHGVHLVA